MIACRRMSTMNAICGFYLRDICEVLLRTDSDVRAARRAKLTKLRNDVKIGCFVRNQILRPEVSAFLRELLYDSGKLGGWYSRLAVGLAGCAGDGVHSADISQSLAGS